MSSSRNLNYRAVLHFSCKSTSAALAYLFCELPRLDKDYCVHKGPAFAGCPNNLPCCPSTTARTVLCPRSIPANRPVKRRACRSGALLATFQTFPIRT